MMRTKCNERKIQQIFQGCSLFTHQITFDVIDNKGTAAKNVSWIRLAFDKLFLKNWILTSIFRVFCIFFDERSGNFLQLCWGHISHHTLRVEQLPKIVSFFVRYLAMKIFGNNTKERNSKIAPLVFQEITFFFLIFKHCVIYWDAFFMTCLLAGVSGWAVKGPLPIVVCAK